MENFGTIISFFLSVIFTIPLLIAIFYLVLGIRNLLIGNREKNRLKTSSGVWAIIISMGVVILTVLVWIFAWKPYFFWWL